MKTIESVGDGSSTSVGDTSPTSYRRLGPRVWIFGGLMVAIGVATSVLMLQDYRPRSYLYLAFYSIPANTAVSVFPHEPVLIYYGKFASLWLAAAAATAGTAIAAYMDHSVFVPALNLEGRQGYKEKRLYRRAAELFGRYPFPTLVVVAFSPVPFWPFKFLCFSVRYPLRKYVAAVTVARFPRYFLLAWLGLAVPIPDWLLIGAFLLIVALYLVKAGPGLVRQWRARRASGAAVEGKRERVRASAAPPAGQGSVVVAHVSDPRGERGEKG